MLTKLISFFLYVISIIALVSIIWIQKVFGDVSHEQFIWHINNIESLKAIDFEYAVRGVKSFFFILALCVGGGVFTLYGDTTLYKIFRIERRKTKNIVLASSIVFFLFSISFFSIKYLIPSEPIAYHGDFVADNYYLPAELSFPKKKNVVIVLAESLENSYGGEFNKVSYIPNLEKVRNSSIYTPNMLQVAGTGWTIAAVTAWHFGLPLKTPHNIDGNMYVSKDGFLPHAESIFDVVKKNGYVLKLVMGSKSDFSGIKSLFSGHGDYSIIDYDTFKSQGYDIKKYQGAWGFRDEFVFERAVEEYAGLKESGEPFILFVQTIDTHSPDGFCPSERKSFFDIRDSIVELDRNLTIFFNKLRQYDPNANDVVIVIGDHLLMGTHDFLDAVSQRTIYNMFSGDVPALPENKRQAVISALDIAPTILHCTGARWENGRFGLGVSLFSEEESLLERYGVKDLNGLLVKPSKKYESFY